MADDILSDNTQIPIFEQCKNCKHRYDGTPFSNKYNKACCKMFPYPEYKPMYVRYDEKPCPYKEKENGN